MKIVETEYTFTAEQIARAHDLAQACGLRDLTARILLSRGIDTPEKAERFLHPSAKNLLSPFLMRGMRELVGEIDAVKAAGGTVAVFGDYDADGVCASAILLTALRRHGVHAEAYIPERADGYGMTVAAVDRIIAEYAPSLIVTVDCGVSNAAEVAYVQSKGVRIAVTDHHELPDELPDCLLVNPKLSDDYPYDNLCGAGVAFKIACALLGKGAYDLIDLAAVATVADSVPLVGENRDIVSEGIARIENRPRAALRYLLASKKEKLTAQSLAFVAAPRINAAGRMGDANCALRLFTSENETEIYELSCRLHEFNLERQQLCDEAYRSAKEKLAKEGAFDDVIMLEDEHWNSGLVGIVAARLAEEFNRPCILFVRRGDMLKGSARTIENINIYEALKACSAHITAFGGHAQAAGVGITSEQFLPLKRALCDYIASNTKTEDFIPKLYVCEEADSFDLGLAKELERLEPYGVGNRRPLFSMRPRALSARRMKEGMPHLTLSADGMDFVWFGGERALPLLASDLGKTVVYECGVSRFRGNESARGIVRDILFSGDAGERTSLLLYRSDLLRLREAPVSVTYASESAEQIEARIRAARKHCKYGLLVIAEGEVPHRFADCVAGLQRDCFRPASLNVGNTVLLSPSADAEVSLYRDVVFLYTPADRGIRGLAGKTVYCADLPSSFAAGLDVSREALCGVFRAVRAGMRGEDSVSAALAAKDRFPPRQTVFALEVFAELGIVRFENGRVLASDRGKTDLSRSAIYAAALRQGERT